MRRGGLLDRAASSGFPRNYPEAILGVRLWSTREILALVFACLAVLLSFLPTLLYDYVPEDQWRAFRYGSATRSGIDRFLACVELNAGFFIQTGRPLVWLTECTEHALVFRIHDLTTLRSLPIALAIVTLITFTARLGPAFGSRPGVTLATAAAILTPAYSFMLYQGLTGLMVLVALLCGGLAGGILGKAADPSLALRQPWKAYGSALALYLVGAFCYPIWASSAFVIALWVGIVRFWPDFDTSCRVVLKLLLTCVIFSMAYFALASTTRWASFSLGLHLPEAGVRSLTPLLDVGRLLNQASGALKSVDSLQVGFWAPGRGTLAVMLIVVAYCLWSVSTLRGQRPRAVKPFAQVLAVSFLGILVLLLSLGPWILSKSTDRVPHYFMVGNVYIYFGLLSGGLLLLRSGKLLARSNVLLILGVITACSAALLQFAVSWLVVSGSASEILLLKRQVAGRDLPSHVAVVPPKADAQWSTDSAWLRALIPGSVRGGNAQLASSGNPVTIAWMVSGVLREAQASSPEDSVEVVDCGFDVSVHSVRTLNSDCVASSPLLLDAISVSASDQGTVRLPRDGVLANLSVLTERTTLPKVIRESPPGLAYSAVANRFVPPFDASGLPIASQPGWHADWGDLPERTWLTIDFAARQAAYVHRLALMSQDGHPSRAPSLLLLESVDSTTTDQVLKVNCRQYWDGSWNEVALNQPLMAGSLRVRVLSNCGDSDLMTVRGLAFRE